MASALPRTRLVQLIATLLSKQGAKMVAEVERRISAGEGLEIKGIKVDTSVLLDALEQHSASAAPSAQSTAAERPSPEQKPSARWAPSGSSARWNPGTASASLLTNKAIAECEQAEPFARSVDLVAASGSAVVFPRPDVLEKPLDQRLVAGKPIEVVARFLSQRDGRVYLRLKAESGWVCTRSCEDLAEAVLAAPDGEPAIEPEKFRIWPLKSPAMEMLPVLEKAEEAQNVATAEDGGPKADEAEEDEAEDEEDGLEDDDEHEEGDEAEEGEDGEEHEDEEGVEGAEAKDAEDGDEAAADEASEHGAKSPGKSPRARRVAKKFKVVAGRCPIISKPGALNGQKLLQKGETFLADGVYFSPAEQRAYLRLTRGLGWVCERARQDLWRLGVARVAQRRAPISKKMAKAVAFRGGDTGGATRLKRDDLVKNSQGKIVSKRASEAAKKRMNEGIGKWTEAVKRARTELGISGFSVVKKGTPLYEKAQDIYNSLKAS